MPDIRRGFVATTLLTALIMTATACGGSDPEPVPPRDTTTSDTETNTSPTATADEELGKVFPGTDGGSGGGATLSVPRAQLDEPAGGTMELANDKQVPLTVQPLKATTDSGELSIVADGCTGVTLQPQETCSVQVSHTAQEPGRWTGTVTAPTAEGPVFSVTLTGEAVGAASETTSEPPTPQPDETPETPDETETPETPDETETPTPEPGLT
ncbi:hypothetical protein [Streptomyces avidinii]|uniref:Small lipoprotein YifL n=1 Tax=Streptomyces avidinii TaxID=1895 RepID=A0ABS4KXH6_STRAV|nr:hypothetical protein [Streptomyces avidinii]MBP2034738.1 putative small lipoprotein YifL [Streptomyces avidinii]GGY88523.1 hypothetical protein GCM10010343_12090 [Streptomyces avidinii]